MSKRTVASIKDMVYTISIMKQFLGMPTSENNVLTGYNRLDKNKLHDGAVGWIKHLDDKYVNDSL